MSACFLYILDIYVVTYLPEQTECNCLTVVHIAFAWIVTEDAIHHDFLLAFSEPPLRSPPAFRLRRGWSHHEYRPNPNHQRENSLQEEQPSPTFVSVPTAQAQ